MATSYTSDKKIGGLDPIIGSLSSTDKFIVEKNGDALQATVAQIEEAMFNTKTSANSPQNGDIVVIRRNNLIRQLATENLIPDGAVGTAKIADGGITTAKIADANVTTAKIADSNVTTAKIADANVTTAKIADANVTTAKIADANVTTAKIADSNVTTGKIADDAITTDKIADKAVTAAQLDGVTSLNTQTGNYTIASTDAGKVVAVNASTDATVTVPTNASASLAVGATITVVRRGAGEVTLAGATGVTIRSASTSFTTVSGDATTNVVTVTGSSFIAGQIVRFSALSGGNGLSTNTDYYVISPSTTTFKLSTTSGGSEIDFTSTISSGTILANTKRIGQQNAAVSLIKIATDEWLLLGNLKA